MISRLITVAFALAFTASLLNACNAAQFPDRTRSRSRIAHKQIEKQKHRNRTTDTKQSPEKSAVKPPSAEKSAVRYQMLSAGDRVVVLDTHTGKTEVIEPKLPPSYQNVEVGRAWVVVTVLGHVSEPNVSSDNASQTHPVRPVPHRP